MGVELTVVETIGIIASLFPTLLGLFVYAQNRSHEPAKYFFYFTITAGAWGILRYSILTLSSIQLIYVLFHILYPVAALMPVSFFYFVRAFTGYPKTRRSCWIPAVLWLVMVLVSAWPGLMIQGVQWNGHVFDPVLSPLWFSVYIFIFIFLFAWEYVLLIMRYRHTTNKREKKSLLYITAGTLLAVIVGVVAHLILPLFGIFSMLWAGPLSTALASLVIVYGMLQHKIFDFRMVSAQVLVFFLWLVLLGQLMNSGSYGEALVNTVVFIITVALSMLLLHSLQNEIKNHDTLERLTKKLQESNRRLKHLDQAKTEFLSIATHQLRTPLTSIRGYLSMLLEGDFGKLPPEARKTIEKIYRSSSLMAETITDFMNVSRIELGHMEYYKEPFSCLKLLKDVVEELRPRAEEAGLYLRLNTRSCDSNCLPIIYGDYGKVKYIFSNLIENAIKYTPKGGITLTGELDTKKKVVRIAVQDTGIGISKKEIPHLFSKFKRARNARNINIRGTGLGLFVAKEMVKAHGGRIWVESEGEGKGSTFYVELPYVQLEKCEK